MAWAARAEDASHGTAAAPATSAASSDAAGWQLELSPYLWMFFIDGDVGARSFRNSVEADFTGLLDAESVLALQVHAQARRDRWTLLFDGTYLRTKYDFDFGPVDSDVTTNMALLNAMVLYRILEGRLGDGDGGRWQVDVLGGGRVTVLDTEVDLAASLVGPGPLGLALDAERSLNGTEAWFDPVVGARFMTRLNKQVAFRLRGDLGGFTLCSDFTTELVALATYDFQLFGADANAGLGYRALFQDYDDEGFLWDLWIHGPLVGVGIRF